jgi:abortive infection bacteriophage resistance protein
MLYQKPALTIPQQIAQLQSRGLLVDDPVEAANVLSEVSYYRLSGYWWPLQSDQAMHVFKPGARFQQAVDLYQFDRELRLLVFDIIERLEIGLRTRMIYEMSLGHGAWWLEDETLFSNPFYFSENLKKVREEVMRSKEVFIKDHRARYSSDHRLPSAWKTLEVVSFGQLSKIYGNLNHRQAPAKDKIASDLGVANHTYLHSWLQSISDVRNICAHHARLWNRHLPAVPKLLPKPISPWLTNVPPRTAHNTA